MFPDTEESIFENVITKFSGFCSVIKALEITSQEINIDEEIQNQYFSRVSKKSDIDSKLVENIQKCLYRSLHDLSFLSKLANQDQMRKIDVVKFATIALYYSFYQSASAAILSYNATYQKKHGGVQKSFFDIGKSHYPYPFNITINNASKKEREAFKVINPCRGQLDTSLFPVGITESKRWLHSAFFGTARNIHEKIRDDVRIKHNVPDLKRTSDPKIKEARTEADKRTLKKKISILDLLYRYRVKAQYKDAVFLSFGLNNNPTYETYASEAINEMNSITSRFFCLSLIYTSVRIGRPIFKKSVLESNFEIPENVKNIIKTS